MPRLGTERGSFLPNFNGTPRQSAPGIPCAALKCNFLLLVRAKGSDRTSKVRMNAAITLPSERLQRPNSLTGRHQISEILSQMVRSVPLDRGKLGCLSLGKNE